MGSKTLALDPHGSQQLTISWSGWWTNVEIRLDGALIGRIETAKQLRAGATFALPDGATLQVKLEYPLSGGVGLHVARNGVPVPGSARDPLELVANAAYLLYFVGAVSVSVGLLAELGQVTGLRSLGLGYPTVALGVFYAVLGYRVMSKHSRLALLLALALLAVSMVDGLYVSAAATGRPGVGRVVMHLMVAATMWRGLTAIGELKRNLRPPRVAIPAPPISADSGRHRRELALVVGALLTLGASIVVVTRRSPPRPVTPVPEEPANVSFFYSYKKMWSAVILRKGELVTLWDQLGGANATSHDVAKCERNELGQLRALYHDSMSDTGPGTFGPWVDNGCSLASEFGYVVKCCFIYPYEAAQN